MTNLQLLQLAYRNIKQSETEVNYHIRAFQRELGIAQLHSVVSNLELTQDLDTESCWEIGSGNDEHEVSYV